jgi:hypothetical protein
MSKQTYIFINHRHLINICDVYVIILKSVNTIIFLFYHDKLDTYAGKQLSLIQICPNFHLEKRSLAEKGKPKTSLEAFFNIHF